MSKYIKLEDAIRAFKEWLAISEAAEDIIADLPTIDIVHCGECKHWSNSYICWRRRTQPMAMNPDDFCSYGKVSEKPTGSERSE